MFSTTFINIDQRANDDDAHIDFANIQVTDGQVGFNTPMSSLAQISHNIHRELMVWYVDSLTIIGSDNCR